MQPHAQTCPFCCAERPVSSSYRPSAFEAVQSTRHSEQGQHPHTFTDGNRMPERHRPILAHMGATYSDGSRIPGGGPEPAKSEPGTPRTQHGFEVKPWPQCSIGLIVQQALPQYSKKSVRFAALPQKRMVGHLMTARGVAEITERTCITVGSRHPPT